MNHVELDMMIDKLEDLLPAKVGWVGQHQRGEWAPFWSQVKQIQAAFKSGVRYPLKEERDQAWVRFSSLCQEAKQRIADEKDALRSQSKEHRDVIMELCSGIYFSKVLDDIWAFDRVTVDQMKDWGKYLRRAMRELSERKHHMLGEHKQECFERIQRVKESHDHFWSLYKQAQSAKQEQRESRQREWASKREAFRERVEANIHRNKEKLDRAVQALQKVEQHAEETRDKMRESDSAKWLSIWAGWLEEDERRMDDIRESIERIMGWIEEDKRKLREID